MKEFYNDYAKEILKRVTKQEVRNYSTYEFGTEKDERNKSVIVKTKYANKYVKAIRQELISGLIAFVGTTRWLGEEKHNGVEIVVGMGNSQFDILRLAQTVAVDYDIYTEDLIKQLQVYDGQYGIDIYWAETDIVEFNMINLPRDLSIFAQQLYDFCPDIIDHGGTISSLINEIEKTRKVTLWWD